MKDRQGRREPETLRRFITHSVKELSQKIMNSFVFIRVN
jgi:hypothetical protein